MTVRPRFQSLVLAAGLLASSASAASDSCSALFEAKEPLMNLPAARAPRFAMTRAEVESIHHDMPGMLTASLTDPTLSTGVTLFTFEPGATAAYDARGGSVSSIETSLLDHGSYSNEIDAVVFAGGSSMGLEASRGVSRRIFSERGRSAGVFDAIPGVTGAIVYDYGGRIEPQQNKLAFPGLIMGAAAYDQAQPSVMKIGRVGAGTTTTANKIGSPIWGGQGAAYREVELNGGFKIKLFTAVILNPHGEIILPGNTVVDPEMLAGLRAEMAQRANGHKQNTTLSITVTDVALDRSQLQRLATMVHTSMAQVIHPFHSYTDGDISFAVSLNKSKLPSELNTYSFEEVLQSNASKLMRESILRSVQVSNKLGTPGQGVDE